MMRDPTVTGKDFILGLFENNLTITANTVLADVVVCSWAGYLPVTMPRGDWSAAQITSFFAQTAFGTGFTIFECTGGTGTTRGYYVTDADANFLLWGEKFADPITMSTGIQVPVLPTLRMRSEF